MFAAEAFGLYWRTHLGELVWHEHVGDAKASSQDINRRR